MLDCKQLEKWLQVYYSLNRWLPLSIVLSRKYHTDVLSVSCGGNPPCSAIVAAISPTSLYVPLHWLWDSGVVVFHHHHMPATHQAAIQVACHHHWLVLPCPGGLMLMALVVQEWILLQLISLVSWQSHSIFWMLWIFLFYFFAIIKD